MNLQIDFGDGNPFYRRDLTLKQLEYELGHWSRNYELRYVDIRLKDDTLFLRAREKGAEA